MNKISKKNKNNKNLEPKFEKYITDFVSMFAEKAVDYNMFEEKINEKELYKLLINKALDQSDYCYLLANNLYFDYFKKDFKNYINNRKLKTFHDLKDGTISKIEFLYSNIIIISFYYSKIKSFNEKINKKELSQILSNSMLNSRLYEESNLQRFIIKYN